MPSSKDDAYSQAVRSEKDRLFALGDAELRTLPEYSSLPIERDGVEIEVGIYHQLHTDGFDVLVAQAKRNIFLGYGHMFVEGFILRPDGTRDRLPDLVYYEYA